MNIHAPQQINQPISQSVDQDVFVDMQTFPPTPKWDQMRNRFFPLKPKLSSFSTVTPTHKGSSRGTARVSSLHFISHTFFDLTAGSLQTDVNTQSRWLRVSVIFVVDWGFFHPSVLCAHTHKHSLNIHENSNRVHEHIQAKETQTEKKNNLWECKDMPAILSVRVRGNTITDTVIERLLLYKISLLNSAQTQDIRSSSERPRRAAYL